MRAESHLRIQLFLWPLGLVLFVSFHVSHKDGSIYFRVRVPGSECEPKVIFASNCSFGLILFVSFHVVPRSGQASFCNRGVCPNPKLRKILFQNPRFATLRSGESSFLFVQSPPQLPLMRTLRGANITGVAAASPNAPWCSLGTKDAIRISEIRKLDCRSLSACQELSFRVRVLRGDSTARRKLHDYPRCSDCKKLKP
uniref:Secreted protein n=1 Tax=Steinernema glaseri TaxID=37863 RepID=A0A1I7ZHP7_9BILA